MPSPSAHANKRPQHWNRRYSGAGATGMSWYQPEPAMSLALIDRLRLPKGVPVIDVGGDASLLVDRLVALGYSTCRQRRWKSRGAGEGTPEDALDCACGLYLRDPSAWVPN